MGTRLKSTEIIFCQNEFVNRRGSVRKLKTHIDLGILFFSEKICSGPILQ